MELGLRLGDQQQTHNHNPKLLHLALLPPTPTPDGGGGDGESPLVCSSLELGLYEVEDHHQGNSDRGCSRGSDEDDQILGSRKKLRLFREQSAFLEDCFKDHHTLDPQKQKAEVARRLNLRPRQVEVWFQNRRARTKLKQTEVDCEYLKNCCQTLTQENRKLRKELQDLRALKTTDSLFMHSPATTLTMCASCERAALIQPVNSKASGFSFTSNGSSSFSPTDPSTNNN
ncbi:homeobox-leucine zipper protein HOX11-like [Cucurbita maxima]|uniref:Homeobox-leucine zipper protein HOX11-like n=1 Tax=Cucurbita maxima TaxID=3661 RepID=A0A6J1KEH0_CUCMA|nr:homeobox-leucine zipper protein HOX11-like [Cucurbita maxima]